METLLNPYQHSYETFTARPDRLIHGCHRLRGTRKQISTILLCSSPRRFKPAGARPTRFSSFPPFPFTFFSASSLSLPRAIKSCQIYVRQKRAQSSPEEGEVIAERDDANASIPRGLRLDSVFQERPHLPQIRPSF